MAKPEMTAQYYIKPEKEGICIKDVGTCAGSLGDGKRETDSEWRQTFTERPGIPTAAQTFTDTHQPFSRSASTTDTREKHYRIAPLAHAQHLNICDYKHHSKQKYSQE